jgi:hypothetical protein
MVMAKNQGKGTKEKVKYSQENCAEEAEEEALVSSLAFFTFGRFLSFPFFLSSPCTYVMLLFRPIILFALLVTL